MKRIFISAVAFLLLVTVLCSCSGVADSGNLKIANATASKENVTVTLQKATAQRMQKPDRYEYTLSGTIENNSDEGVMRVIYTFSLIDGNGEEFRSFAEIYDGLDGAIPLHSSIAFSHDGIRWGAQSVPAAVSIGISSVQTETQLPPARIPQPGDYLYEIYDDEHLNGINEKPPVELSFHIDQGGYGRTAVFDRGEPLAQAVRLFCGITISAEADEWVTDNYNWIRLVWEDGSVTTVRLNLRSLEYPIHSTPHTYALEHLDEFWSYASAYLEEDG